MIMRNRTVLRFAVSGALLLAAGQNSAQETATAQTILIEEIVVTAEKREEKLQDVPVAVSAFTDASRSLMGIRSIEDFASFTPGLNFSSNDRLSVRGVGRLTNVLGSDPGVATYNDGFYTSSTTESNRGSIFVDRVEFLRGPQGTLYGRNSMGGAINVVSKRPIRDAVGGEVRATYANYDTRNIEGTFSGPLSDSLAFRISGQSLNRDEGYFENDAGEDQYRQDRTFAELQLEADLGDRINWWLKYSFNEWGPENSDGSLNSVLIDEYYGVPTAGQPVPSVFPTGSLTPNGPFLASAAGLTNPSIADPYRISENTPSSGRLRDNHTVVTQLVFDLGATSLKYVGGWQQSKFTLIGDFDRTSIEGPITSFPVLGSTGAVTATVPFVTPVFPEYVSEFIDNKRSYSNEINLSSNNDVGTHWIVGLYQFHEEEHNPTSLYAPRHAAQINNPFVRATPLGTAPGAVRAAPSENGRFFLAEGNIEVDSYAAFGQVDFALSDAWTITTGVRYTRDEKTGDETNRLIAFLPIATGTGNAATDVSPVLNQRELEDEWSNVSGKLGAQWRPNEDAMLYASYSRGYKSGGFNLGTIIGGADRSAATVDEEILDAFEFGWKTNLTSTFQLNGALFYYQYDDVQVPFAQFRNGVTLSIFENIDATSYGAEIETVWAATDSLSFLLNYSYLKVENTRECQYRSASDFNDCYYDNADPAALAPGANRVGQDLQGNWVQDLDGNQLPQAPEHKAAFNANYRFDFGPGSLTFSGSYVWQDETTYSNFANPGYRVPDYDTADFRVLWNDAADRYTVIAFVDNAFDDEGYLSAGVTAFNQGARRSRSLIAPRTYGAEVQVRF